MLKFIIIESHKITDTGKAFHNLLFISFPRSLASSTHNQKHMLLVSLKGKFIKPCR